MRPEEERLEAALKAEEIGEETFLAEGYAAWDVVIKWHEGESSRLKSTIARMGRRIRALRKELRLAQSANAYLCSDQAMQDLRDNLARVVGERDELLFLFNLQRTRSAKAMEMWRQANGITDGRQPDLGQLLEWLMAQADPQALTIAHMQGYHSRDDEVRALKSGLVVLRQ